MGKKIAIDVYADKLTEIIQKKSRPERAAPPSGIEDDVRRDVKTAFVGSFGLNVDGVRTFGHESYIRDFALSLSFSPKAQWKWQTATGNSTAGTFAASSVADANERARSRAEEILGGLGLETLDAYIKQDPLAIVDALGADRSGQSLAERLNRDLGQVYSYVYDCPACHGAGSHMCSPCAGKGGAYALVKSRGGPGYENEWQTCMGGCYGKGRIQCMKCGGHKCFTHLAAASAGLSVDSRLDAIKASGNAEPTGFQLTFDESRASPAPVLGEGLWDLAQRAVNAEPIRTIARSVARSFHLSHSMIASEKLYVAFWGKMEVGRFVLEVQGVEHPIEWYGSKRTLISGRPPVLDILAADHMVNIRRLAGAKGAEAATALVDLCRQPLLERFFKHVAAGISAKEAIDMATGGYASLALREEIAGSLGGLHRRAAPGAVLWPYYAVAGVLGLLLSVLYSHELSIDIELRTFMSVTALIAVLPIGYLISRSVTARKLMSVPEPLRGRQRHLLPVLGFILGGLLLQLPAIATPKLTAPVLSPFTALLETVMPETKHSKSIRAFKPRAD